MATVRGLAVPRVVVAQLVEQVEPGSIIPPIQRGAQEGWALMVFAAAAAAGRVLVPVLGLLVAE
jgi:hypothetical protein